MHKRDARPSLIRLDSSGPPPAQQQRTERKISQELAKEWFRDEVHSKELGAGGYGETRTYEVQDAEYRAALGPVVVVKHFNDDGYEDDDMLVIRELARREHDAHHAAWKRMPPDCRQYLAQPATMSFEDDPNVGSYLVQTLVGEEGLATMSWGKFDEMLATTGVQLDRADKVWIAQSFGDMLGCIANARMVHKDFNTENVLVLTNFGGSSGDSSTGALRWCAVRPTRSWTRSSAPTTCTAGRARPGSGLPEARARAMARSPASCGPCT